MDIKTKLKKLLGLTNYFYHDHGGVTYLYKKLNKHKFQLLAWKAVYNINPNQY